DLVRREMCGCRADARETELLRDRGDDGHGAIGGHGHHTVDGVIATHRGHRVELVEVDRLADVGELEPWRLGVAVDRDDPHAELLHAPDSAALVPARADEEDGLGGPHGGATLLGRVWRNSG